MFASAAPVLDVPFAAEPGSAVRPRPRLAVVAAAAAPNMAAPPHRDPRAGCDMVALRSMLRRRALRWCRNEAQAEDLVQEALLRAFAWKGRFETEDHLQAWLHTVLHNLFISRQRRERSARRALGVLEGAALGSASERSAPPAPFLMHSLEAALSSLPEPFARVVRLVDLDEHSYADAAALLGVPVGTVMSRLFRGRQKLARALSLPELGAQSSAR